jgi:hypothetical protein
MNVNDGCHPVLLTCNSQNAFDMLTSRSSSVDEIVRTAGEVTMALQNAVTGTPILAELALIGASACRMGQRLFCGDYSARSGRVRSLSARVVLYARTWPEMAAEALHYCPQQADLPVGQIALGEIGS